MRNILLYLIGGFVSLGVFAQEKQYVLNSTHSIKTLIAQDYSPEIYEIGESNLVYRYAQNADDKFRYYNKPKVDSITSTKNVLARQRSNRKVSFVLGEKIQAFVLSGVFEKLASYKVMASDYGGFLKHELIRESTIKKLNIPDSKILLNEFNMVIVNLETGKYYFVKPDFLKELSYFSDEQPLVDYTDEVIPQKTETVLPIKEALVYDIAKYEAMIQRCKELTSRLIMHNKRIDRGEMTKTQVKDWKRDLVEAKLLNYRIDDFLSIYDERIYYNNEYVNKDMSDSYNNFSRTLDTANRYAGF